MRSRAGEILSTIILIVVILAIIIAIRDVLLTYTQVETPLVIVHGYSMYPYFLDGDIVLIISPEKAGIKPGDIVVYSSGKGYLIIHRVISIQGEGSPMITTKGDNNLLPDFPPTSLSRVKGVVASITLDCDLGEVKLVFKVPVLGGLLPIFG
ncbi:MAG: signal peptidase I [Pyrodictiaceae archaeon]